MTTNATISKSTLLSRAALIALTVGAAGNALAAEAENDQPAETIVVTGTKFNTDAAPAKASLDTTEPQTIINRSYIENFVTPTADYVTILSIVPGMTGGDPNGPGLSDGGAKNTLRGLGDGNFVMQYDGIPFGDTNGPSHHNISYFPASTIGSAVVDRGPGNAGNFGPATYGGTIKLFSRTLSSDPQAMGAFSYGSFGTQQENAELQTGSIDLLGGTKILLTLQQLYSDGALSLNDVRTKNALFKSETPIGSDWKVTLFSTFSHLNEHLSDNNGLTPGQVAVYGKDFALQNTNPSLPTYWAYNWTKKQTDMDYVRVTGDITRTTRLDNTAYTYAYWNHTFSPNNQTQTLSEAQNGISEDTLGKSWKVFNGVGLGAAAPAGDLLAYDKVNSYRVFGDILRLSQDYDFGWVSGEIRAGAWLEEQTTHRYKYMFDETACAAKNIDPWAVGRAQAAAICGVGPAKASPGKYEQNGALGFSKDDEYSGWQQYEPFLEVDIKPIDGLVLTPGVKYVHWNHKVNAEVAQGSTCGVSLACAGFNALGQPFQESFVTTDTLPFFQANYKIDPSWSVYFEYAKGIYVPDIAAFETNPPTLGFPAPQTTTNYQVGTVFYADNFTFDADLYTISVNNNYVAVFCSYAPADTCYVNNGKALYKGVEGEGTYAFGKIGGLDLTGLSLFANGALMSSKAEGGNWQPNAPRWTLAAGLLYKTDAWKFSVIDKTISSQYSDVQNNGDYRLPSYSSVSLSGGYTFQNVEFSINVDNLLDSRAIINLKEGGNGTNPVTSTDTLFFQAPRSIIGTLKASF